MLLRPFGPEDFDRLISWVPDAPALMEWCGAFFCHPLDAAQLGRYLESGTQPHARAIFTAQTGAGEPVGHIELSHIWPHLSSRLSRVLIAPACRRRGFGAAMVAAAVSHSFREHHVCRIDLGVVAQNTAAIRCYEALQFEQVGLWPQGSPRAHRRSTSAG